MPETASGISGVPPNHSKPEIKTKKRLKDSERTCIMVLSGYGMLFSYRKGAVEEWIRFFNAESEEELEMLKAETKNAGILEAIRELKELNLRGMLRAHHEMKLKARRDRRAQDAYEREEGRKEGLAEGLAEGYKEGRMEMLVAISLEEGKSRGETIEKLMQMFAISAEEAEKCFDKYAASAIR